MPWFICTICKEKILIASDASSKLKQNKYAEVLKIIQI